MRRKFTRQEFRAFIAGGKRQGVFYSKKEKRFIKNITFKDCFMCPDGYGVILISPNIHTKHFNIHKQNFKGETLH